MLIWVFALRANKLGLDRDCFQKRKSPYLLAYLLFSIVFLAITRGAKSVAYPTYRLLSRVPLFIWVLSFVLVIYLYVIKE